MKHDLKKQSSAAMDLPCTVDSPYRTYRKAALASSLTPFLWSSDPTRLVGINNILQLCEYR